MGLNMKCTLSQLMAGLVAKHLNEQLQQQQQQQQNRQQRCAPKLIQINLVTDWPSSL